MSTTLVPSPTSHLRFGMARVDITPPVGMYHPMWGAARHQRATGIHRPLSAEVMAFAPLDGASDGREVLLHVQLDHIGLEAAQQATLLAGISQTSGVPPERVITTHSHSHSTGNTSPDRLNMPGGELIEPYLRTLYAQIASASMQAVSNLQEAVISYGTGRCNMAAQRDYWDEVNGIRTCGYNPDAPADDTLLVGRVSDVRGRVIATIVNYACHPTTLAWENTLISPDYIGSLREVVEAATAAPCVFLLGICGELGARRGHQGDTAVADANGRQVGYAALSTLAAMLPPATDFAYTGPVVSGATLGTWAAQPLSSERKTQVMLIRGGRYKADLPQKPRPSPETLQAELEMWQSKQREADAQGDAVAARNAGAHAERARRWQLRVKNLPATSTYPLHFSVYRLGDAIWVTTGGEPYSLLQSELRRRFPQYAILISPLAGDMPVAYLLNADSYGTGLYQEEPSILAKGCLELLIEAVAAEIEGVTR